jgi:thymidylate kinase
MDADLAIAIRFIESLNRHDVAYCHWKSNLTLANALTGGEDLDLLIDRKALPKTVTILADLGFKAAVIRVGANVPGIYHYYGLDSDTGKLCHVHLYNSILTGESFVKSHTLPIEKMLLENCEYFGQVRIASKSAELVLFILRIYIKYSSLLDLLRLLGKSDMVRTELHWLQAGADISVVLSLLEKYCPVIDEPLFLKCIETLEQPDSLIKRLMLASAIRWKLRVYAKYTLLKRLFAYVSLLLIKLQLRLLGNKKNKTLQSGGAIIAFTGADATGKSTLVAETRRWLGSTFSVRAVHVGKPPSSLLMRPVNNLLPLMRHLLPQLRRSQISNQMQLTSSPSPDSSSRSLVYAVRAGALAWDRYQLLIKVRRWAANGEIVICDRYPTETINAMDSPRLQVYPQKEGNKVTLYDYLARLESRLYKQMPPPHVVLKLRVSIETAKQRNRNRREIGMDAEDYLEARHRSVQEWQKQGTQYVYDINTEMSLEETALSVKKAIWVSL